MYPCSTTSSSSCQSHNSTTAPESGLTRYGSAPGSLLRTAVDAVGAHYFTGDSPPCKVNNSSLSDPKDHKPSPLALHRSYALPEPFSAAGSSSLLRQRSSPAGFLNHLATSAHLHDSNSNNNPGFTITRGSGSYTSNGVARLKSQLSFTGQDSLAQISEVMTTDDDDDSNNNNNNNNNNVVVVDNEHQQHRSSGHGYGSSSSTFAMDPWTDNSNSIVFSSNKRSKSSIDGDILNCLSALDSQFGLPQSTLEMATMDKLMHIPEDSVPCKIRAKRGCATHPRSIAERERRTRISGKLKKLQELVPNMDKQTSYADMLDLAVQHIKGLQGQVQKLHNELENCTCGCKPGT